MAKVVWFCFIQKQWKLILPVADILQTKISMLEELNKID